MPETVAPAAKISWWFWMVGVVAVLWNGVGAADFAMSALQGETYYRQMGLTEPQIAYLDAAPAWMWAAWAIGTVGGVVGGVLLLLRSRFAFHAFVLSFVGFVVNQIYCYVLTNGAEVMGSPVVMTLVIGLGCLFFIWFARWATKRGYLR